MRVGDEDCDARYALEGMPAHPKSCSRH